MSFYSAHEKMEVPGETLGHSDGEEFEPILPPSEEI
jgi:hypothetical protein